MRQVWLALLVIVLIGCGEGQAGDQSGPLPGSEQAEAIESPPAASSGSAMPRYPFPQHVAYAPGTILPNHLSQQELDQAVADFYTEWKRLYLRQGCGEGRTYVHTTSATGGGSDSISVSEGHGYGMIITALMAGHDPQAQALFDGLYWYFKDHPSVNDPYLMAWNQVEGCGDVEPGNTGSATDGDMDIAYGLLLADRQWGSEGPIDYYTEAIHVINAIREHEVNPETSTIMLGDWVTPDEPGYYFSTRTSDWMPGHFRAYADATGDSTWADVLDTTYALIETIQTRHSPQTGLLPDFVQGVDADPRPADPHFLESEFDGWTYYNACRDPWRIGVDVLLAGDPRGFAALGRLNAWISAETGGDPTAIRAGYALDGSSSGDHGYTDLAFVAPLGVGAMAGQENQAWLNAIWDFTVGVPVEEGGYYDNTLKLLALIAMSGNWWGP